MNKVFMTSHSCVKLISLSNGALLQKFSLYGFMFLEKTQYTKALFNIISTLLTWHENCVWLKGKGNRKRQDFQPPCARTHRLMKLKQRLRKNLSLSEKSKKRWQWKTWICFIKARGVKKSEKLKTHILSVCTSTLC